MRLSFVRIKKQLFYVRVRACVCACVRVCVYMLINTLSVVACGNYVMNSTKLFHEKYFS